MAQGVQLCSLVQGVCHLQVIAVDCSLNAPPAFAQLAATAHVVGGGSRLCHCVTYRGTTYERHVVDMRQGVARRNLSLASCKTTVPRDQLGTQPLRCPGAMLAGTAATGTRSRLYTHYMTCCVPFHGLLTTPACHSGLVLLWLFQSLDLLRWVGSSRLVSMLLLLLMPASPRTCCICALLLLRGACCYWLGWFCNCR